MTKIPGGGLVGGVCVCGGGGIPNATLALTDGSCIKMYSGVRHFSVLFTVKKRSKKLSTTTIFEEKRGPKLGIEPMSSAYQPNR